MTFVPQRIMIFGRPGGGKSTFAFDLHQSLGLPLYHLDKFFFTKNWIKRDTREFLKLQQKLVNTDNWIIDGNSIRSLEMRYARADLIIYFNYPRWICYYRVLKRRFFKDKTIDDRASGCYEKIRLSLLSYMWTFEARVFASIQTLQEKYPEKTFMEVTCDEDVSKLKQKFTNSL